MTTYEIYKDNMAAGSLVCSFESFSDADKFYNGVQICGIHEYYMFEVNSSFVKYSVKLVKSTHGYYG